MTQGVNILLKEKAKVPSWIENQGRSVHIGVRRLRGRKIRVVTVRKAEASFIKGGQVGVKMSGTEEFRVAFEERDVLEIRSLNGRLIRRNNIFCLECVDTSGRRKNSKRKKFWCQQCKHKWVTGGR